MVLSQTQDQIMIVPDDYIYLFTQYTQYLPTMTQLIHSAVVRKIFSKPVGKNVLAVASQQNPDVHGNGCEKTESSKDQLIIQ